MRREPVVAGLIGVVLLAGGCTGGSDGTTSSPPSSSVDAPVCAVDITGGSTLRVATLVMVDRAFLPGCFVARGNGQTLRVKNADHVTHTFTIDGTDVDIEVPAGTTITTTGDAGLAPGTYLFHCRIHPSMTGVMIVRPAQ